MLRSLQIAWVAALLGAGPCFAVQLTASQPRGVSHSEDLRAEAAAAFAQEATSHGHASGSGGFVHAVVSRLQKDLQSLLPAPASRALGFVQEGQEPGHLNPAHREQQSQQQARQDMLTSIIVQAIFIAIFALIYEQYKVRPEVDPSFAAYDKEKLNVEWESGYFACFNDMSICMVGCCCPLVLWSDNMSLIKVLAFWTALAIVLGIFVASAFIPIIGIATLGMMVWGRSKLRQKFNMNFNTPGVLAEDIVCLFCCGPCVICQDARHLEAACKAGHEAVAEEKGEDNNAA